MKANQSTLGEGDAINNPNVYHVVKQEDDTEQVLQSGANSPQTNG
jgi:hypothetical protein